LQIVLSAKRFAKPFYGHNLRFCKTPLLKTDANRFIGHNLHFCKTALQAVFLRQNGLQNRFTVIICAPVKRPCLKQTQIVLSAKRFTKPFYGHNLRFCKTPLLKTDANRFIGKTVYKTVLL